jgi:hypothetical protein
VLYDGMRSDAGPFSALYFIAWIFIGNFVLLNLFLAILLENFSEDSKQHSEDADEEDDKLNSNEDLLESLKRQLGAMSMKKEKQEAQRIRKIMEESPEQSIDFDMTASSQMKATKNRPLYDGIECERSYYIFAKSSVFRILMNKISVSSRFESVILTLIVLSSMKLVYDTYIMNEDEDSRHVQVSTSFDLFFTVAFTLEMLIKTISAGLVMNKGSYLRESWNHLDMFIVVFSWIEFSVSAVNIPAIKVLRLLRTLRPLRFISHNVSMKIVVIALLESVGGILNVVIVVIIIWLMFAILGVSLFAGKFYHCEINSDGATTDLGRDACNEANYDWRNADSNFDSVL